MSYLGGMLTTKLSSPDVGHWSTEASIMSIE